jgi:hypothetical protein
MDNETLVAAYQRELAGAIERKQRDRVELIRAELDALGVKAPVESAGTGSATKRTRKATT